MLTLKGKRIDIETGGKKIALLHKEDAGELGVHPNDRISVTFDGETHTFIVDVTRDVLKPGELGLFEGNTDEDEKLDGKSVQVEPAKPPRTAGYIKKRLLGQALAPAEIKEIIRDVVDNKLSDIESVFFMSSCYSHDFNDDELSALAEGMVEAGKTLSFPGKLVASKHCTGGVPGNRTTMIVIPICVAAGLTMAKTSARAISSPAGTADVMEVLCSVEHSFDAVTSIVNKVGGCIIWNGAVNLSPADDRLNQLRYPLRLDPEPFLLASILSKKKAEGAKKILIDIPIARGGKFETEEAGRKLAGRFISLGTRLGLDVEVALTAGDQPIGNGIGPALEAIDVLKVLECAPDAPDDLRKKALTLAGLLLEHTGKAARGEGEKIAENLLASGKALAKFREIVHAQGGSEKVSSATPKPGKFRKRIFSSEGCSIFSFINSQLTKIARAAGAPKNKGAGIYLFIKKGAKLKKGDPLYEIYSESEEKLEYAAAIAAEDAGVVMQKPVLEIIESRFHQDIDR
ncbi:MAG: AMP phosphorylase [archaeon]